MDISNIQPIHNKPALFIKDKKILVLADLHIGIESELRKQGLNTPSRTKKMLKELLQIIEEYKPRKIVLLGDIKHNIPSSTYQERKDVKNFLKNIQKKSLTHIIPGNHDGSIQKIKPDKIKVHSSQGLIIENIGFTHGHRWPSVEIINKDQLIIAHSHPTVMLTDRLGYKSFEPCWVKACFNKKKLGEKYNNISKNPEVLIIPAFNPLCGGIPVNKDGIVGPFGNIIDVKNAQLFLLDGTLLGKVKDI